MLSASELHGRSIGGRAEAGILIGAVQDQDLLVGQNERARIPALILHVRGMRRIGVVLVPGIGVLLGMLALGIGQEVRLDRRHAAIDPGLAHRIEDGDLADAVVAALVVAADERPAAVRERDVAGAEDVVVQPLEFPASEIAASVKSDVGFGDQRLALRRRGY